MGLGVPIPVVLSDSCALLRRNDNSRGFLLPGELWVFYPPTHLRPGKNDGKDALCTDTYSSGASGLRELVKHDLENLLVTELPFVMCR